MSDFKYLKFFTIIFILIISINFVAATDDGGESTIVGQEIDVHDVYGDSNKEVYVDPSQSSGGNGSKDSPYNSIQSALDNLDNKTSNTIILKDGIYAGEANTKVSLIGNLIVKADEGATPTIDGGQTNNFWTLSDSNILLQGITFKNFNRITSSTQGILTSSNIDNLTVSGCTFENNTYARAMNLNHLNNTVIDGCTFQDNDLQSLNGGGVYSTYVNNLTFSNNIAQNQNVSSYYDGAVLYSNYNTNVTVVDNRFKDIIAARGAAFYSNYDKKLKFENNYFDNVGGSSSTYYGRTVYVNNYADDFDFINNTVMNTNGNTYSGVIYASSSNQICGEVNVKDNYFENNIQGLYLSCYNGGNVTVVNNTFNKGGGLYVYCYGGGNATVVNNSFTNNSGSLSVTVTNAGNTAKGVVVNNTFTNSGSLSLSMSNCGDAVVTNNSFTNKSGSLSVSLSNAGNINAFENNFTNNNGGLSLSISTGGNLTAFDNNFDGCLNNRALYVSMSNADNMAVFDNNIANSHSEGLYVYMSNSGDMVFSDNNIINSSYSGSGGAAYFYLSSNNGQGIIKDNNFTDSLSKSGGGAMYVTATLKNNLTIENNNFTNSLVNGTSYSSYGGAMYVTVSRPYNFENKSTVNINNNNFVNSSIISTGTYANGGALYISSSSGNYGVYTIIENNTFINSSSNNGGTIYASVYDSIIKDNTVINSSAQNQGGVIYLTGTNNTISNHEFNNGSALQGGAIYIASYQNNVVNNTFDNNTASTGGAIYISSNQNNIVNNTFDDNNASSDAGAIFIYGNNNKLIDNVFYNNAANSRGGAVYSRYGANNLIDNDTFDSNKAQIGGAVFFDYYQSYPNIYQQYNYNNSIINSRFIDNEAETAGAVVLYSSNAIIANSTFIGNNATRYGSGAVSSGGRNNVIRDNLFENNTAFLYAGAIGTNDTAIINNTFKNNTAFQAGAILTINSTIANNTFSDNYAIRGINIAYVDNWKYANKTLLSGNKGLSEDTLYAYDEDQIINVYKEIDGKFYLYDNIKTTSGTFSFQGYCIEQDASIPIVPSNIKYNGTWGILVDDLFFVRNSLDQSYVGDYLKVLIMKYQNYEHYNIKDLIYVFTDGDYRNSRDPIIQDVIKLAENCYTILENGNNTIENITYPCEFYTFINPTTRQNMIIWNCSNPIVIPTLNPSKTLVESKTYKVGDNVTFRITVTNDKNFTFHNVTIRESVPTGFTLIDWINLYDDDLERISDNVWILKRDLKPGEKVQFDVVLKYDYYYSSSPYNYVYVDSLETESQSSGVRITVEYISSPDLVITKVPSTYYSQPEGAVVYFDVLVTNPASSRYTSQISIRDYWSSSDYKYIGYESDYAWSRGSLYDGEVYFYYSGGLDPGETISLRLFYEAKYNGYSGNRYNYVVLNGNQEAQAYYYIYNQNTGVGVGKSVYGPNPSYVGARLQYYLYVYNRGYSSIYNAWIEEKFPEEWIYDGWSGSSDWVHQITEDGTHRWTYTKPLGSYTSQGFYVYFNLTKPGTYTNIAIAGADDFPTVETSVQETVVDTNLNIGKFVNGPNPTYVGARMPFGIYVYNNGYGSTLNNVWVEEKFPDEWIYDGWYTTGNPDDWVHEITDAGAHRWTYTKPLSYGQTAPYIYVYFNMTKVGNYTNVAIAGADNVSNKTASVDLRVLNDTFHVLKYVQNSTYNTSSLMNFTIVVYNANGFPGALNNVWFEEHFPKEFIFDHWEGSDKWILNISDNGTYRWTYNGTFTSGPAQVVNIYFKPTVTGNFTNNVTGGAFGYDNVTASVNVTVNGADIKLEKITNNVSVELGNQVSFTIRLTNVGDNVTSNMYVREMSHPGLVYDHFTTNDLYWKYLGDEVWQYQNNLTPGQSTEFIVYYNTTMAGLTYNAINSTFDDAYPRFANNTTFVYVSNSNVEIQKITIDPEIWQGDNATFTIVVKNTGEVDLTGIKVYEQFDEEMLGYLSFNGTNWSYDSTNRVFKFNQTLAINQTSSFNVTFAGKKNGTALNTVTVYANEYGNKTTSNTTFIKVANFTVEKLLLNKTVTVGDTIVYTIVVTNTGNAPLTKVTVVENYPSALEFVSVNNGWSTDDNVTFVYGGSLDAGGTAILNISFKVIEGGNVTNIAVVSSNETQNKSVNNTTWVKHPKIDLQKLSLNQTVDLGEEVIFTIVVTNNGNVDLNNITLYENYPSGLVFVSFNGDNWTTDDNVTFKYDGLLAVGDSIELNITFNTTEQGKLTNIVSVTSNETKEVFANNTTFVKAYNFDVEKLLLNKTVTIGDTIVYTIVVSNTGSAELHNVTVVENYPAALEFVSVNSGWSTSDNKVFTYDAALASGADAILNITFKVVGSGNITNIAVASSNEIENKSANNTTFVKDHSYIVEKIGVDKVVSIGEEITYIIKVTNTGNCELTGINVTEKYSSDLEFIKFRGDWTTEDNKVFVLSKPLSAGSSSILSITFKVLGNDNITNPIDVSTNENKTNITTNETISSKHSSISVDKYTVNDTVYVGEQTAFDIVVTNTGSTDLDNIVLTEDYPAEIILDSYYGEGWTRDGDVFTYNGVLKPGKAVKLRVIFNTTVGGEFVNEVTVRSNNVSDSSCNITKVIYRQKPTPVNPVKPVKPVPVKPITPPIKVVPIKHGHYNSHENKNKLPGGRVVLTKHPTANPFGILLLMILVLSVISLIRVKSVKVEINNKNFIYLVMVVLLVLLSAGCAVAADVDDSTDDDLSVSVEEVVVVESSDVQEEVVTEYAEEVVIESSESSNVQNESGYEVVVESSSGDVLSASDVGNDVYQAPQDAIVYVNPDAGTSGDGSYDNPYNSINAALNGLDSSGSNTIMLMDGIYKGNENTQLLISSGDLSIKAYSGAKPVIDFGKSSNGWNFTGSNILIEGITFNNATSSSGIIKSSGNLKNFTISKSEFNDNIGSVLLDLTNVDDIVIKNSKFNRNTDNNQVYGIKIGNSTNFSFMNNNINRFVYNLGGLIASTDVNNIVLDDNNFEYLDGKSSFINLVNTINFTSHSNWYNHVDTAGDGGVLYLKNAAGNIVVDYDQILNLYTTKNNGGYGYIEASNADKISIVKSNILGSSSGVSYGFGFYISSKNSGDINITDNYFSNCKATNYGGALYINSNNDASITLDNNEFDSSEANYGGAVYLKSTNTPKVTLTNNDFEDSRGRYYADIYASISYGDLLMDNNTFDGSYATYSSGSSTVYLYLDHSDNVISNNKFIGDSSKNTNERVYINIDYGNVAFKDNEIINFTSTSNSGVVYILADYSEANVVVDGNKFINSTSNAGSLYLNDYGGNDASIINNEFINSSSTNNGGAIFTSFSPRGNNILNINNNTIINSTSNNMGGAIYISDYPYTTNQNIRVNIEDNKIINSSSAHEGGAIYITSSISSSYPTSTVDDTICNNEFINCSSASNGGGIYIVHQQTARINSSIINNSFINDSAKNGGAIAIQGNNFNISDNEFVNNNATLYGGSIFSQKTSNDVFDNNEFVNGSAQMGGAIFIDYPQNYGASASNRYENKNITISNSEFNNNSAELGGAVVVYSDDTIVFNSTFANNNATRYGSGALVSGGKNSTILNNTFENNTAFLYGGAVGTNNSAIINNTFINNSAYQAGAILTINSTIVNNTFVDNEAKRGSSIVYLDTYNYKTKDNDTLLVNNTLPDGSVYTYNSTEILSVDDDFAKYLLVKVDGGYLYEGYCIEQNASIPLRNNGTYGIVIDDLSFVRNSLDQSYVGDYIKVLFISSKLNNQYSIREYVTIFTDTEYWNSTDPFIQSIINITKSSTFSDDNTVVINKTIYQFQTFVNPTTRQNLILMNSSVIVETPEIAISKVADKYQVGLNDVIKYTVTVTNKKNMTVHGLVISESLPYGLTFVSIDNSDNQWSTVTSTSWKLNRELKPFESVQLVINARVSSESYTTRTNTVTAKIDELPDSVQASATVNIRKPVMNIDKFVFNSASYYYPGDTIKFVLNVYNSGDATANSVYIQDSYPSQLEYVGFSSSDKAWYFSSDSNNRVTLNYGGVFKAGQMSTIELIFKVKDDAQSTSTSNYAYVYLSGSQVDSSYASFSIGSASQPNFNIYKYGPSEAYVGSQFTYNINVGSVSGNIREFYIDEIFPSEWEYVSWYGPTYFVHTIIEPNHHRWTFIPSQSSQSNIYLPTYSVGFSVVFKCDTPGNYTNTVVGFAKGVGNKTASVNTTVVGPVLSIEKIIHNPVVYLGDQVTFTIRVNNTGGTGASNFYVNELPASGLVFDHIVDSTGKWIYNNQTSRITYTGTLDVNSSVEVDIVFNTTKQGTNVNIAQLMYANTNIYVSNSTYVQNHNMTVEKWYLHFYNTYGQNTTFVVRVKNTGNLNLTEVFVEENQFDGLNYLNFTNVKGEWSVVENNGKYLFKLNGNLTPGDYAEFDVLFNTTAYGKLTNIVVAGSNETENITANASVVSGNPSIKVEKIASNKTVYVGDEVTFTINVENTGTMPLYGLAVQEFFPDNLEYVSSTGNWIYDSKNNVFKLETALSACEPNSIESFNVTFRAVKGGNATNIVNVTSDIVNETANETIFIKDPNFTVQKVVVNKYAVPDDEVYFTVTVTNTGNMNLTDVKLKEMYPDSLEFLGIVGDWSTDDNITFKFNDVLYVGNSTELTLRFKAVKGGNATNVVDVSTNETKFNKTANDTVVIELYDFEVEKLALNKTVMKGDNVVYTVVITNTGNKNLTQITLVENYCDSLEFVSVNDGWTTSDNRTFVYNGELLQPGENAILNITFKTVGGNNMTNVVVVRTNETDNKTAYNNTTYVINPEIDVEKLVLNKSVNIGDEVQFTIVVTNVGNVDLANVTIVESYDDGRLEFVRITSEGWNTTDNVTFVYAGELPVGNQTILNITFKALDGGNAINIVDVTTNETSGNSANNTTFIRAPDFTVEKLLLNNTVKANDTIVYSVVVTNTGNTDLTDIKVVEDYPSALEFISNSANWETSDNKVFTFIGSLAPGDKAILNITFKAVGIGNVTNVVNASTNETVENRSTNNTTFVKYIDYTVRKVGIDKVVFVGEETTFIIEVTNLGNVDLKGIKVYENYPSSLKYVFYRGDWDTSDFREFTLTSSLAPGESTTLNITFKVVSLGNITNPIDVVFEDENKTTNDTIFAIKAEINVDKISLNRTVYAGDQSGFDIIVTNTGNIDLSNVTLFEDYPKELIFDSFVGDNWTQSGNVFKYSGILKAGESIKLFVLFNTTKAGVFTNNVDVHAVINISEMDNLTDDIIDKISNLTDDIIDELFNNLTDSSSNITKVNIIYPEPETPEPVTPETPEPEIPVEPETPEQPSVDIYKNSGKSSNGAKSGSGIPLESKTTGNPLALLALLLLTLIVPLRRKK